MILETKQADAEGGENVEVRARCTKRVARIYRRGQAVRLSETPRGGGGRGGRARESRPSNYRPLNVRLAFQPARESLSIALLIDFQSPLAAAHAVPRGLYINETRASGYRERNGIAGCAARE